MPPRTRTRTTKVLKENIEVIKNKLTSHEKVTKPPRMALADKTNSLSDDNASIDIQCKTTKTVSKNKAGKGNKDDNVRPRRERRLPPRYIGNHLLKNLSNNKDSPIKVNHVPSQVNTPVQPPTKSLLVTEIQTKTNVPYEKITDHKDTHTKASSKFDKKPVKSNKIAKNSDKLAPHADGSSKDQERSSNKLVKNTAKGTSKVEKITTTTLPKGTCLQSVMEKLTSESHTDNSLNASSPFKTPSKVLESSFDHNRPKRICRLPSKFEDHSVSPNKFIPIQPCHASTPIQPTNNKMCGKNGKNENFGDKRKVVAKSSVKGKSMQKGILKIPQKFKPTETNGKVDSSNSSIDKNSPDANNNGRNIRAKRVTVKAKLQTNQVSPDAIKIKPFVRRLLDKSPSFRVLEENNLSKKKVDSLDVYEFTFDPNEEPKPQKKKRKKPVKKRPDKPKVFVLKSNYNENVSKALANLRSKVKPSQFQPVQNNVKLSDINVKPTAIDKVHSKEVFVKPVTNECIPQSNCNSNITPALPSVHESVKNSIHESNYASIGVEDIAADFDSNDHHDVINYSPVNSPIRPATPKALEINESHIDPTNKDPLNLQGDLSFFDANPIASSSMNVSVRHPLASPWRVEFGSLPMKWHSNTYVKPNMTPAVESSFINSEIMAKKKQVYTDMVPVNESLLANAPNLKQPSIISFMREVAEKSANKKKRRRSPSPTKVGYLFTDVINTYDFGYKTPKKAKKTAKVSTPNVSDNSNDKSNDKENSNQLSNKSVSPEKAQNNKKIKETAKVLNQIVSTNSNDKPNDKENLNHSGNKSTSPVKAQKNKDKDGTYFGFDNSDSLDQENVSPVKIIPNARKRGLRARAVLQEFNSQAGPTRAAMPVAAKAKLTSVEVVEQLHEQLKSAEDAPQIPEKEDANELADITVATNVQDPSWREEDDNDSQSVHLFEDIEVVHHLKHHQKSYGKSRKVNFRQHSSDSDAEARVAHAVHSSDDDLADLMFEIPNIKQKKVVKRKKSKKQLSKKEEKEVEAWAAGFNSMCEDVDEFILEVE